MWPGLAMILVARFVGTIAFAQEKPTQESAAASAPRPRIDAASSLSLEEARIIIEAAVARVRADKAHAAIAVVDDNGNLVSMDRIDGTSSFFARFGVGDVEAAKAGIAAWEKFRQSRK
jgi:hypothetical protein